MGDGDEESRTEFTEGTEVRGTGISYRKVGKVEKVRGDSSFSQEGKDQVAVSMGGEGGRGRPVRRTLFAQGLRFASRGFLTGTNVALAELRRARDCTPYLDGEGKATPNVQQPTPNVQPLVADAVGGVNPPLLRERWGKRVGPPLSDGFLVFLGNWRVLV